MENPITWALLVIVAIIVVIWFTMKCEEELSRNRQENEDFFWEYDHKKKYRD